MLACGPSASVQRSTPVANLQIYRSVLIRAVGAGSTGQYTGSLELTAATKLREKCKFEAVYSYQQMPHANADLVVDVNILRSFRGGAGFIKNENKATVEVAMFLSDKVTDEILGSADIRAESSSVKLTGSNPELEAVNAAAAKVADILKASGCGLPRVARAVPKPVEPTPPPDEQAGGPSPEDIQQAETYNTEGKQAFRSADVAGAKAKFEQAIALVPSVKYYMNLCLANEALKDYPGALGACQKVVDDGSDQRLAQKATERMQLIRDKQGG
jgi:tetratricopeptide (TPR) repeat protein